jgi:hypothetical protein
MYTLSEPQALSAERTTTNSGFSHIDEILFLALHGNITICAKKDQESGGATTETKNMKGLNMSIIMSQLE